MENPQNLIFPVFVDRLYSTIRKTERVDLILSIYSSLGSFFNSIVADVVADIITDGSIHDYEQGLSISDDEIMFIKFQRVFRQVIDDKRFGKRLLEDIGLSSDEIKTEMKKLAYDLLEVTLGSCYDAICEDVSEKGKALSRVNVITVYDEIAGTEGYPTQLKFEASFTIDDFRRID